MYLNWNDNYTEKWGKFLLSYPSEPKHISYEETHPFSIPNIAINCNAALGSLTVIVGLKY